MIALGFPKFGQMGIRKEIHGEISQCSRYQCGRLSDEARIETCPVPIQSSSDSERNAQTTESLIWIFWTTRFLTTVRMHANWSLATPFGENRGWAAKPESRNLP